MWTAICLLMIVLTLLWYSMKPFYWSNKNIPYLIPLPLIGNCIPVLKYGILGYFKYLHSLFPGRRYFGIHFLTRPALYIKDPDIIRQIFITDFEHFTSRGFYTNQERDPGGANLLFLHGQQWKEVRGKLSPYFTPGRIRATLQEYTNSTLLKLFGRIDAEIDKQIPIEITSLFYVTFIDIVTQSVFGTKSDSFENRNSIFTELGNISFNLVFTLKVFISGVSSKLYNLFNLTVFGERINNLIRNIVVRSIEHREKENISRQDFLQGMMELMKTKSSSEEKYFDDGTPVPKYDLDTVVSQAIIMYIAGIESSSLALSYLLYELAVNPGIQDRCRAEIKSVVQQRPVTHDDVSELVYLSAAIEETLRKYPIFPFIPRECTKAYTFPDSGLTVEPGTLIFISPFSFQMDENYFREPHIFRPERFLDRDKDHIKRGAFLIPFGLGPRNCLGRTFAEKNIKLIVARLLQQYEFHVTTKTQIPVKYKKFLFHTTPTNGLWVQMNHLSGNAEIC